MWSLGAETAFRGCQGRFCCKKAHAKRRVRNGKQGKSSLINYQLKGGNYGVIWPDFFNSPQGLLLKEPPFVAVLISNCQIIEVDMAYL